MAQESGPLVGANFTDTQWRAILGGEPGIVGDVDGSAFNITLGAGTDDALLGSSTQDSVAVVGGFMHRIAEDSTQAVTIPPSTNVVGRTDIIAVRLDAGTYTSAPGPCRLVRIAGVEGSAARPSMDEAPPGVEDFPLWAVTRKGNGTTAEGLNQAAKVDLRRRTGPNLLVPASESLPPNVPLGTRAARGDEVYRRRLSTGGTAEWVLESPIPPRIGVFSDFAPEVTGTVTSATRRYYGVDVPAKPYARNITVEVFASIDIPPRNTWRIDIELAATGSPNTAGAGERRASQRMGGEADGMLHHVAMSTTVAIPANVSNSIRVWLVRTAGSDGITVFDEPGGAFRADWVETSGVNNW
jgi:hypothetical protein